MSEYILYNGRQFIPEETIIQPVQRYRQPHDTEIINYDLDNKTLGRQYRGDGVGGGPVRNVVIDTQQGMPEVYRLLPEQSFWITEPWKQLTVAMNPKLAPDKALSIYSEGAFLCNTHDFLCDAMRICGGAIVEALSESNGNLYLKTLLINNPVPTAAFMDNHPELWYYGTTIVPSGANRYVTRKGIDGSYYPVKIPFVSEVPVYVTASWMDKLPANFIPPSPLWRA